MQCDLVAFEQLYVDCFERAYAIALRLVNDRHTAEDIASESLARAFASWGQIAQLPYRELWVLRVASNLARDHVRRRRRRQVITLRFRAHWLSEEQPSTAAEVHDDLRRALGGLPKRQLQAVMLCRYAGFTEAEVATALGVSKGTVNTHVQRGLLALRTGLADAEGWAW
ncbi:MAG: hypothetical protein QOI20_2939 [Acidimicrobiaceae bacterium]|nr:hypothetical protein [Acidimicrobiaceae bacterium]